MRGHVRKRGNKWAVVVFLGYDELGRKRYKWYSGFATKRAAERALPEKIQEVHSGAYVESPKQKLGDYMKRWLEDKSTQIRPNTLRSYQWLVNGHIIPGLGHMDMSKLRPQHLQTFYTKLLNGEHPLSNRSVQFAHVLIHEALQRAVKWGLVSRNVADAVDAPRPDRSVGTTWTTDQVLRFLDVNEKAEPRYWIGFLLAITTGMRKGEILALRWSDLDLDKGYAQVNQTLTWIKGQPVFQEPKTDRSRRSIALPPHTIEPIRAHRAHQIQERLIMGSAFMDNDLVIGRVDGRPVNARTFDDDWYRGLRRSELPKIRFHDLRHTHASLLLQLGVHPKIVSERLGHSTINITLDTYSHVLPGLQEQVAQDFGDALFKRPQNKFTH